MRLIDVFGPEHCLQDMLNTGLHMRGSVTYSCASKARRNVCSNGEFVLWLWLHNIDTPAQNSNLTRELVDPYITPRL